MDKTEITLYIAIIIVLYLIYKTITFKSCRCNNNESFIPIGSHTKTFGDWDNYAKDYGNTREYWGSVLPGGGWSGSPYSPENNPSGSYNFDRSIHHNEPKHKYRHSIVSDLANASDEELNFMYKAEIMRD